MATLLAGCASGPMGSAALTDNVKSNTARLIIYRSSSLGFAVMPNYAVDGRVIGGSQAAGFLSCDLLPGRHEVAVNNLPLSSNLFGQGSEKVSVELRAGSTTYLAAQPQMGIVTLGAVTLIQVTEGQGRADVASLRQSNSSCGNA
ncbi:hypothetical protein RAD16_36290 [Bradyrhizobium sp. 18BD]